jgi:hypothetical protein
MGYQLGISEDETEKALANAHLIAAAPDMLEALEAVCKMCGADINSPDICGSCGTGKAIAKATPEHS